MRTVKAQVEFVVIFALIAIAVIVVIVSSRLFAVGGVNPAIIGTEQEKKLISDSVTTAIMNAARNELREIYKTGGFSDAQGKKVKYGAKEIGVWQDCDGTQIPDIGKVLEERLENDLRALFKPEMEFFGKIVNFDMAKLDVAAAIQENGVKIDVNMPTTVENSSMGQPYSILIPSNLGRIIDTARAIINRNNASRFFEAATMNTILYSNPGEKWLPTIDLKTGCRDTLFRTESEVGEALQNFAGYTASHTVYNKEIAVLPDNPFYVIGVSDYDINVSFIYPEEWDIESNMDVKPNPVAFYPSPIIAFSSVCIGTTDVRYSMRYPLIAVIRDDAMDQLFNFAIMVNIDDNKPSCGFAKGTKTSYDEKCVSEAECSATISVKGEDGLPIGNALVTFGACSVGGTDYLGLAKGIVPCMVAELSVHREGYGEYKKLVKASSLRDYPVVLEKEGKAIPVHFYGVPLKTGGPMAQGSYKDYHVSGQPRQIDLFAEDYFVLVYMKKHDGGNIMLYNIGPDGFTSEANAVIGKNALDVFGAVVNNKTGETVGYIEAAYLADGNENGLYVYLPLVEGLSSSLMPSEISKIKAALSECDINVISDSRQDVSVPCG